MLQDFIMTLNHQHAKNSPIQAVLVMLIILKLLKNAKIDAKFHYYLVILNKSKYIQKYKKNIKKYFITKNLEQCSFIPDKGPCMGKYERWYYDSKSGICKSFTYGGCIRNKNNHMHETDCIDSCVKPKQKSVCLLPKIVGNCDQRLHLWYYDFKDGKCKPMVYSGCNGNLNRFESLEACEYTCQGLNEPSNN